MRLTRFFKMPCLPLFICLLSFSTSAAKEQNKQESYFDEGLARQSYGLALLSANANYFNKFECKAIRSVFKEIPGNDDIDFVKEQREWCLIYDKAAAHTAAVVEEFLRSKELPSNAYVFYVLREEPLTKEDGQSAETSYELGKLRPGRYGEVVGLFANTDSCQEAELRLRQFDMATRPCRVWSQSRFFNINPPSLEEIKKKSNVDYKIVVFGALGNLIAGGGLFLVYYFSKFYSGSEGIKAPKTNKERMADYLKTILGVAVLSFFVWGLYGTH